jgi:hypothetical protein
VSDRESVAVPAPVLRLRGLSLRRMALGRTSISRGLMPGASFAGRGFALPSASTVHADTHDRPAHGGRRVREARVVARLHDVTR